MNSGCFLLSEGIVGPWVPLPALCQGASREECGPHGKRWWLVQGLYEC